MRARLAIVFLALIAVVGVVGVVVVPSEALTLEPASSVVDQVASCRQASGLARDAGQDQSIGEHCRIDGRTVRAGLVVAVLAVAGALSLLGTSQLRRRRRRERWSLPEAVARAGAPWRAPPLAV